MKKARKTLMAALAAATLLIGCGGDDAGNGGEGGGGGDVEGMQVAYLTVSQTCEYCARQAEAFVARMEEAGAEVTMTTTDFDAAEQAQQINQAISTQPDLLVIWPTDPTSVIPALERINQTDIPVVVTTYLPATEDTSLWDAWVGPNDHELGEQAAQLLVEGLEASGLGTTGGIIEVAGAPGGASTIGRGDGFRSALAELAPDLEIIGSQPGNWDQTQATTAAAALLSQHGADNLIGMYSHADNMLAGAILAAEREGLQPGTGLIAVGSDCTIEGYTNIEAGKQYGTNLQDPVVDGQTIADQALAVLAGEEVENITYISTPQITADNLQDCAGAVGK